MALLGTAIKGAARLAGNSLSTSGKALEQLSVGDLSGAGRTYRNGASQAPAIVGETASRQLDNIAISALTNSVMLEN